jgi:thiol:disulfide interchange protein DsbD
MLDFTGHSCANCRKMEKEVWKDEEVLKRMRNDFVLVSLYVDESTELPLAEQYNNKDGDLMVTEGDRNLDYEITQFGFNAQPLYMFLDTNGKLLSEIKYGYNPDVKKFIAHLESAKQAFNTQQK